MNTHGDKRQAGISLVELLVGMTIMTLISAMLIGSWIALSDSYSFTTKDTKAREYARDAIRRMGREIRDAQPVPGYSSIRSARPYRIEFTTLFNDAGAANVTNVSPKLTQYRLRYVSATQTYDLWRVEDSDGVAGISWYTDSKMKLASNVVRPTDGSAPLFEYYYYDTSGHLVQWDPYTMSATTSSIVSVKIRILVDLNPGRSPNRTEFVTTIQPRNSRQF